MTTTAQSIPRDGGTRRHLWAWCAMMQPNRHVLIWAGLGILILAVFVAFVLIANQPQTQGVSLSIFEADQPIATAEVLDELNGESVEDIMTQESGQTEITAEAASEAVTPENAAGATEDGTETETE